MTKSRGIRPPRGVPLADRLERLSVDADHGCRLWVGSTDGRAGYGKLHWQDRMQYARRLAWENANGPIPAGLEVRHRCDVPACIALAHLELGTHRENVADQFARGRAADRNGERNNSARLNERQVNEIRARHAAGETGASLARAFGVSQSQVSNIIHNRHWKEAS